jgi:hypothetical protein
MAFSPIAFIAPNYTDFKTYWLKAYEPSTTTPKAMALESDGGTQVSKLELNADGFLKSAGGALVIPYIDGSYDLWLFPTEAEADNNITTNAERVADNITGVAGTGSNIKPMTLVEAVANTSAFDGQIVQVTDRADAQFTYLTGQTPNTYNIIAADKATLDLVLRVDSIAIASQFGVDGNNDSGALQAAVNLREEVHLPRVVDLDARIDTATRTFIKSESGTVLTADVAGGFSLFNSSNQDFFRVEGVTFVGSGQYSSSTSDTAIFAFNTKRLELEGNTFKNFVVSSCAWLGSVKSARISNNIFKENGGDSQVSGSRGIDVYGLNNGTDIIIQGNRFEGVNGDEKDDAILLGETTAGSTDAWTDTKVLHNFVSDYGRRGIVFTDESPESNVYSTGNIIIDGNTIFNIGWSAIKAKNTRRCRIVNNYCQNFEVLGPENSSAGLTGGILANNSSGSMIVNNILIGVSALAESGISAFSGNIPSGTGETFAAGTESQSWVISGNVIRDLPFITSTAIIVKTQSRQVIVADNSIFLLGAFISLRNPDAIGIDTDLNMITVSNNIFRAHTTSNTQAAFIQRVRNLELIGNIIYNSGSNGIELTECDNVGITGGSIIDSGRSSPGGFSGIRITNATVRVRITGVRTGNENTFGTTNNQGIGLSFAGTASGDVTLTSCDFRNNTSAPLSGASLCPGLVIDKSNIGLKGYDVFFASGDATPSVKGTDFFLATGTTNITNFDDGDEGQIINVVNGGATLDIVHDGVNITTISGANLAVTGNSSFTFRLRGTKWLQMG